MVVKITKLWGKGLKCCNKKAFDLEKSTSLLFSNKFRKKTHKQHAVTVCLQSLIYFIAVTI